MEKGMNCPFCVTDNESVILQNESAIAMLDGYPVTPRHTLIIPRRHIASVFDLTNTEWQNCFNLLKEARQKILSEDVSVAGFNIGVNIGTDAGQTIPHVHIHLIPRRKGDVANPRGGVRHIIPGKGNY